MLISYRRIDSSSLAVTRKFDVLWKSSELILPFCQGEKNVSKPISNFFQKLAKKNPRINIKLINHKDKLTKNLMVERTTLKIASKETGVTTTVIMIY